MVNLLILETRPLGGRQFLMVVAYREERFLLSVCPGRVEYLCALPGLDVAETDQAPDGARAANTAFGGLLEQLSATQKKKD